MNGQPDTGRVTGPGVGGWRTLACCLWSVVPFELLTIAVEVNR